MKIFSRIVFTIIYLLVVAIIIYLPTREHHFQGEIVNIEVDEDEMEEYGKSFISFSSPTVTLTLRDSDGKQYIVLAEYDQSFKNSNDNIFGHVKELKVGDYIKGTYSKNLLGTKEESAKEITLIVK